MVQTRLFTLCLRQLLLRRGCLGRRGGTKCRRNRRDTHRNPTGANVTPGQQHRGIDYHRARWSEARPYLYTPQCACASLRVPPPHGKIAMYKTSGKAHTHMTPQCYHRAHRHANNSVPRTAWQRRHQHERETARVAGQTNSPNSITSEVIMTPTLLHPGT